jgi:fructose-1,6-bisphosphatase/inositol monophosphatase family enzyme
VSGAFASAHWVHGSLFELAHSIRTATRTALLEAVASGTTASLARAHGMGAGDVTYAIDVPAEQAVERWFDAITEHEPVSLLTEDAGWRHRGPTPHGARDLDGFDHGGPRIVVDPIDGTRNLMTDLRPAWSVITLCPPGPNPPRLSDVTGAVLSEIPDSRAAEARLFRATSDGRVRLSRETLQGAVRADGIWHADTDDRADNGYFPFFRYMADLRPDIARIEAAFFSRLETHEKADIRTCWDDQYISNGGQLALLALGTYRLIADLRAHLAARRGRPTLTCKPYDCAGAILVARATGCIITAPGGGELDFELDTHTPVSFIGWANAATRARLEPHLNASLA